MAAVAVAFEPGSYYRSIGRFNDAHFLSMYYQSVDVEGVRLGFWLRGDVVLCLEIVYREGGRGRGRYAKLAVMKEGRQLTIYHRVSKNSIGSGNWKELNSMVVLALADQIPN